MGRLLSLRSSFPVGCFCEAANESVSFRRALLASVPYFPPSYLQFVGELLVLQSQRRDLGLQSRNQSRRCRQTVLHLWRCNTHTHTCRGALGATIDLLEELSELRQV